MTAIEKKLKESEERFKALFKGCLVPTYAWQKVGDSFKLIDYNNAAKIITHGNVKKFLGDKASEMYKERIDILEDFNRCFEQKTTIIREMKYFFASLKEEKYLLVKYAFLHPDLVLVHTEDITEQKKAEEKVQYQAKLVEDVSDAIISTDLNFNIISWNKAAESIYGWKADDAIGKSLREIIPIEYPYDEEEDVLKKFFEDGFWKGEVIQKHKDGTYVNILTSVSLVKDIAGNPIGAVAINRDISESTLVEQKLKESESKFRSIFEAIPDLYFLLSEETTILDYRGKQQELYVKPEEFMGKKMVEVLPPYLGEQTMEIVKKTIITKQPQIFEYQLSIKDNIRFYESRYFYLSKNRVSCFIRDITERKKIEKDLSDLAKFPSENPNPVLRADKEKILYINQSGKYLFDTTEGGKIPILLEEMINEAFDDNTTKFFEIEVNDKIYSFDIAPIQQGGYANIYGQDITERKNSEMALNIEKQFTEDILNSSLDTIFVFEPETGKTLRWNKVFKDKSGYTDEELTSMKAPDSYYSEEDLKIASEAIKRLMEEGKSTLELSLITKDGRRIPYEYKATVLKEPNGKLSIVSIGRDMTERKEAEQNLKESEEKFRNIAEQSFMGISVIQDGIFKYMNGRTAEVNGYSVDEMKKWKPYEFAKIIHPEDREFVMEQARKKQESDTDVINQYAFRIVKKNGEIRWLEIFSKTIKYEGSPADLTMTIDITDKIEAEQKLKESEIIFRDLYEEAPNGYFSIGTNQSIIRTNKAAKRLLGYTKEEFSKINVFDLYSDTKYGLEKAEKVFKQFINGETIKDIELQMKNKKGDPVWVSLSVKPIFDSDGNVMESRSMVLDITERKNTEEALRESETRYKEALDMANFYKDLFTHDMNNILQIINSSAEIIGFQLGDSEKSIFIENMTKMIRSQVDRGAKLISDVRTLTELDDEEITTKRINISKFLNSSLDFVKKAYRERNILIFAENLDQKYYTNANELLQDVFDNILINGIKYNENLGVEISIEISRQIIDGKNYFKIEFIDNGIGVPDDRKKVIFQRGNRELKGSKGMGIGLSLVKKILKFFEGKIWVEDKIKDDYTKGSIFNVILPEVN